jgi:hypothetical protein
MSAQARRYHTLMCVSTAQEVINALPALELGVARVLTQGARRAGWADNLAAGLQGIEVELFEVLLAERVRRWAQERAKRGEGPARGCVEPTRDGRGLGLARLGGGGRSWGRGGEASQDLLGAPNAGRDGAGRAGGRAHE